MVGVAEADPAQSEPAASGDRRRIEKLIGWALTVGVVFQSRSGSPRPATTSASTDDRCGT